MQKPFLKWVGGKTQLLNRIETHIPTNFNNYHEIFLGGGSMLFKMIHLKNTNKITCKTLYAYDINKILIDTYNFIKNKPNDLYDILNSHVKEYKTITTFKGARNIKTKQEALQSKETYYYYIRYLFNTSDDELLKSALFLFLNKTCFRGLYREGPNGFNVPFGHYKKSSFITLEEMNKISELIQEVVFQHMDFTESIQNVKENDFCYLDPPYFPENSLSFIKYNKIGFTLDNHNSLFEMIKEMHERKSKFLFSNSNTDYVKNNFETFDIILVSARRAINSKKPQSKTMEVLIKN